MTSPESSPELSVVCRSCGSEVSPYVTECPYCGHRIRKRAPKLERQGDEITVREPRRRRRWPWRLRRERRERARLAERPYATIAGIGVPAILLLVERAADLRLDQIGAIVGTVGSEWWRYLSAPFAYDDLGYLFVIGVGLGLFMPALERRLGLVATALLAIAAGALGMLGADAAASLGLDDALVAAGGNGIALGVLGAWVALQEADRRRGGLAERDYEVIGVAVAAAVLLALPVVESSASPIAGVVGGIVGVLAGWMAALTGYAAEA